MVSLLHSPQLKGFPPCVSVRALTAPALVMHPSSTHTRLLVEPQLTLGSKNRTKSDFFDNFQTKNGVNLGKWSESGQKSENSDPLGQTANVLHCTALYFNVFY